jgi:Ca2+-binding RTX toxin-like protein
MPAGHGARPALASLRRDEGVRVSALRRSIRPITVSVLLTGILLPSPAHAAPLCAYDTTARTLTVTAQLTAVVFGTGAGFLTVNDVSCAVLSQVDTVNVDLAGIVNTVVIWDLANGPFGPGFSDEGTGSNEIEWSVTGMTTGHAFNVLGTAGADGITVGSRIDGNTGLVTQLINMNSLEDGLTPDVDVVVHGAPGQMKLVGYSGEDILMGGGTGTLFSRAYFHPMTIDPGAGKDTVLGGSAPDSLFIDVSEYDVRDSYAGGGGTDSAFLSVSKTDPASPYISLDDSPNDGIQCPTLIRCEGDNYASDIEQVFGSTANDRIVGNDGPQTINGGRGTDTIEGLGGDDLLEGGPDADVVNGGAGVDTVVYARVLPGVSISLNGIADDGSPGEGDNIRGTVENAIGTASADQFFGNAAANLFDGGGGNDLFTGRDGDDRLYGRKGDDTFNGGPGTDLCAQGPGVGTKLGCEL